MATTAISRIPSSARTAGSTWPRTPAQPDFLHAGAPPSSRAGTRPDLPPDALRRIRRAHLVRLASISHRSADSARAGRHQSESTMPAIIRSLRSVIHSLRIVAIPQAAAQDEVAKFYKGRNVQRGGRLHAGIDLRALSADGDAPHRQAHSGQSQRHPPAHAGRGLAQGDQLPRGGRAEGWLRVRHDQPGEHHRAADRSEAIPFRPAYLRVAGQPQYRDLHLRLLGQGPAHLRRPQEARGRRRLDWAGVGLDRRRARAGRAARHQVQGGARLCQPWRYSACLRARRGRRLLRAPGLRAQDRLLGSVQVRAHGGGGADGSHQARRSSRTFPTRTNTSPSRKTASCSS